MKPGNGRFQSVTTLLAVAVAALMVAACAQPQKSTAQMVPAKAAKTTSVTKKAVTSTQEATSGAEAMYRQEPPPLSVIQCAQCHRPIYKKLQKAGGRHRFACTNCHTKFHSYNPTQHNWRAIMPKCSQCHKEPHGPKFTKCLKCHQEPHTPLVVPMTNYVSKSCKGCHTGQTKQLTKYPSAHTDLECSACHDKHGFIPSCFKCHEPHIKGQTVKECKSCHPVHKPLQIQFKDKKVANAKACSACHDTEYDKWSRTKSKHGTVECIRCHTKHGEIPQCTRCHTSPHPANLLAKFPRCLDCHMDVHDLPVKR